MRAVYQSTQGALTHQPSRILENEGQYDTVDLDGTNVWPTLGRHRQNRTRYTAVSLSIHLVDEPMYDCYREPDENSHGDDEVRPRRTIQLLRERPSNGITIERLHNLPAPDIIASWVQQDLTLSPGNGNHYHYGARFISSIRYASVQIDVP